ncbi:DEAD/DEAH box helicase [Nocardioides sp. JQ2195]|uniref:DEAD/DEAH box helicase n=1 Tax=Nocardioides sp. JQ2195 TaxID=2592334 RepID=UPI00143EDA85|nr:DEAD/DEAH box helicase [Nocardioides sp. JQ2195]QIX27215.1 DEAD/DEAH box helicase [Nocardioides sp. JQ2195]
MSRYDATPWLRDLTKFQRRSVEHVMTQFYGAADANRFLVADETGLGKTRVAQGVIARAIEELQDSIPRIDVVYVCANSDLARQNIRRLNVTGQGEIPFSSRLTLLGEHSRRLNRSKDEGGGVNLISFTPGTSFDMGQSLGQARERAMIAIALMELYQLDGHQRRATKLLFQGGVATLENFERQLNWLRHDLGDDGIDPVILGEFGKVLAVGGDPGLGGRYETLVAEMGRRHSIPKELRRSAIDLVRELRAALAAASVHTLEPDLVILDEFQRFRHLLSENNPAGELAHHLFEYDAAKVLLLSATPYKPFTFAGEDGEDHAKDLFRTLEFLAKGREDVSVDDIRAGLRNYRSALLSGDMVSDIPANLREHLLKLMSRAERPSLPNEGMTVERVVSASDLRAADLTDFATMHRVADAVRQSRDHGLVTAEYWKSAPYFLTFADGYQLGRRLRDAEKTPELAGLLKDSHHISGRSLERFEELEPGNARMRVLASDTVDQGWWQLLWLPPSLMYVEPSGPFADEFAREMTKRLVFSSWTATPSSVASILSYEAERRAVEGSQHYTAYTSDVRKNIARRLQYTAAADGKPKQMAAFLCHWPLPGLAGKADPIVWVAANGGGPLPPDEALAFARTAVAEHANQAPLGTPHPDAGGSEPQDRIWRTAFSWSDSWPERSDHDLAQALVGTRTEVENQGEPAEPGDIPNGLAHHIRAARTALGEGNARLDDEALEVLAEIALYSPANVAWRAMNRLVCDSADVTDWGLFKSAATLANGLRSLFNRPDAIQLVERLGGPAEMPYWRKVLRYIAMGNLEAVLDEYVHQLYSDRASGAATDELLLEVAHEVAEAVSLRSPTLRALDAGNLTEGLSFAARFALRYGGRQQDAEDARQPEVRRAFNSPFWPFVLASTSVGQEGIDFHWWCHAVFHWNTPPNPVDFEQREGRVDRYRGHAVRKNVAYAHGRVALSQTAMHPWDQLYELAKDHQEELGDFSPGWVYPGPHRIERHIAPFAFSTDLERYDLMKRDVALYRLTFGQPRQEDVLDVLRRRGLDADPEALKEFKIDLAP